MLEWLKGIYHGIERSTAPRLLILVGVLLGVGIYFLVSSGVDAIGLSGELPNVTSLSTSEMSSGDYVKAEATSCLGPYYTKTVTRRRGRRRRHTTVTYYYLVSVNPEKSQYMSVEVEEGKKRLFEEMAAAQLQTKSAQLKQTIQGAVEGIPKDARDSLENYKVHIPVKNSTILPWELRYETLESAQFTVKFAGYVVMAGVIVLVVWLMLNFKFYIRRGR